jgi:UDP-N-acetyl-D-mannosaminuronic acid transferase (WecB/TagA/CpsF family)
MLKKIINFNKIKFYDLSYDEIKKILLKKGGYLVAPAASSLNNFSKSSNYLLALRKSTVAIFDSGFFCLSLLFLKWIKVKKFSGFKFIENFLDDPQFKKKKLLSCDKSIKSSNINKLFLKKKNFKFVNNYICPIYNKNNHIVDKKLLRKIFIYNPNIIIINIAGGVQELLAYYLNSKLKKKTIILCTGAALSFHSGEDAKITTIIDNLYLGWFMRVIYNPKIFFKRIFFSIGLVKLVIKSRIKVVYE